jgi:energy-coupling factor transport system ATP-binding protein
MVRRKLGLYSKGLGVGKVLKINDLTFIYKNSELPALVNIDLEVKNQETVYIMGRNGSGKSTLLYSINGIIPGFYRGKKEGKICINEMDINNKSTVEISKEIGFLFQDFDAQLFSSLALQDLVFGLENLNFSRNKMDIILKEFIERFDLSEIVLKNPNELSGGQKQKLALASVLVMNQALLLCDEPTTDLDPISKEDILNQIIDLNRFSYKTLLITEHETEYARKFDKLLILNSGKTEYFGEPEPALRNISLLKKSNIRPLQLTELFSELLKSEEESIPLSVQEAYDFMIQNNIQFNDYSISKSNNYTENIINISNLSYSYGFNEVLKDINLDIQKGKITAIMGQNGSGKTTLIKLIIGLLDYKKGEILINKVSRGTLKLEEISKEIGFLFQNPDNQIFNDSVYKEVAYSVENKNSQEITRVLRQVNLYAKKDHDPFSLTKSEKQKLALATILVRKPEILILDEPTSGLDYKEQLEILTIIKELKDLGHTIIMITHSNWITAEYADKVVVFAHGEIVSSGDTREVFSNPDKLLEANIKLPDITELGLRFGHTILSVPEAKERLNYSKEGKKYEHSVH